VAAPDVLDQGRVSRRDILEASKFGEQQRVLLQHRPRTEGDVGFHSPEAAGHMANTKLGGYPKFVGIDSRIKAMFGHRFLMHRREDPREWGFSSAELFRQGDGLVGERLAKELVETVERIDAPIHTVAIHIPGTNTFSAKGVWVHNDMPGQTAPSSGSGSSSSGSGSGSGSGSSSSSGSSASKSSGSSMSSSSSSGSGSGSGSSSQSSGGPGGTYSI
jgi:hypothetical protein